MTLTLLEAQSRAVRYAAANGTEVTGILGFGIDGWVFRSNRRSAIKVFERQKKFETERDVYLRLGQHQVRDILGHTVPELLQADNASMIVEMSIVQPPYLLDFAQATLDVPPDFTLDAMQMWRAEKAEQFGERWAQVQSVMGILQSRYGIHLTDINPGNIAFEEDEGDQG